MDLSNMLNKNNVMQGEYNMQQKFEAAKKIWKDFQRKFQSSIMERLSVIPVLRSSVCLLMLH